MADTPAMQKLTGRAVFIAVAGAIVFFQLLPLNLEPVRWPAPDLLLAATLAWVARRPSLAPFPVVAAIFLLTDLLFQRPPGLYAALVLVATEMLRARRGQLRNMPFALEWGTVALFIAGITLANRIVHFAVMMPQATLGLTLIQMLMTILSYPLVAGVARLAFGVSRPAPGQVDSLGHRL